MSDYSPAALALYEAAAILYEQGTAAQRLEIAPLAEWAEECTLAGDLGGAAAAVAAMREALAAGEPSRAAAA